MRAAPPLGSDVKQSLEQAHADADEADDNADQEQGIARNRLCHGTDPADSGGKDLRDDADDAGNGHTGTTFHVLYSFLRNYILENLNHNGKADKTKDVNDRFRT